MAILKKRTRSKFHGSDWFLGTSSIMSLSVDTNIPIYFALSFVWNSVIFSTTNVFPRCRPRSDSRLSSLAFEWVFFVQKVRVNMSFPGEYCAKTRLSSYFRNDVSGHPERCQEIRSRQIHTDWIGINSCRGQVSLWHLWRSWLRDSRVVRSKSRDTLRNTNEYLWAGGANVLRTKARCRTLFSSPHARSRFFAELHAVRWARFE